jgi:aminopeptidase N
MKKTLIFLMLAVCSVAYSQKQDTALQNAWKKIYRATPTRTNDLVHTKLDVKFDIPKARMYGKAWITVHPHFYPTDSLILDAKKMEIDEVALVKGGKNVPLQFTHDSAMLRIALDRKYYSRENYTVYIRYITRYKGDDRSLVATGGLHFVNPDGKNPKKPVQVWTQGETETNSYWVPIIDKPNQKTTDEISMTVPSKYVTLSNGVLASSRKNSDGTRTDTWKMDLPHAPYLMMMGIGEFVKIRDRYKGKEVSYYVEREYAPVARKIFGLTPEMIAFFSRITGVDYPWQKYSQIAMHEFGGAMENTTATIHSQSAQQDARELLDGNRWESTIAH